MSKIIAALDLGTNTFHLLIASVENGKIHKYVEEQRHVKLGEGGINKGLIAEQAYERGLEALRFFKSIIDSYPVDLIRANGTAALRTAANGDEFITQVKNETGIEIGIIPGDREAELIYKGVRAAVELDESSLIMDIGGGSVEFIFCNQAEIFWKRSYPVGAAKLMATFHHSDPINKNDKELIHLHLIRELKELKEIAGKFRPLKLVGSAGAFETFAALEVDQFGEGKNLQKQPHCHVFTSHHLQTVIQNLITSTHIDRANNSLILPVRTDMIVVASLLAQFIIEELQLSRVEMSTFSLKEGLLIESAESY
ncbi:Ppx/GppA phosphatase family protein [Desertivirga arenae]|uniref:Ppx/GppA phosphatase family protein n=1 Tax=Desertivirga arenae TaxID=2810309 RepID=UPI001A97297C|nr:exopolyphosphatase [Pedobacter sp. SYSU D00823]